MKIMKIDGEGEKEYLVEILSDILHVDVNGGTTGKIYKFLSKDRAVILSIHKYIIDTGINWAVSFWRAGGVVGGRPYHVRCSFEEFLDLLSEDEQTELLFHLDLFT